MIAVRTVDAWSSQVVQEGVLQKMTIKKKDGKGEKSRS